MGRMRFGIALALETEANDLLARSMEGVTSHAAKSDILTPWKEQQRRRKEVYVTSGIADPSVRSGMYNRVLNPTRPDLNSRDHGAMPAKRDMSRSTLADHVERHLSGNS